MITATVVWSIGFALVFFVYQLIVECDVWYVLVWGALAFVVVLGIFGAKYNERFKVALEHPFVYF